MATTSADFESRFAAPAGAFFQGRYLAGASKHPSGGVTGWPGRLTAQHALHREQEPRK